MCLCSIPVLHCVKAGFCQSDDRDSQQVMDTQWGVRAFCGSRSERRDLLHTSINNTEPRGLACREDTDCPIALKACPLPS